MALLVDTQINQRLAHAPPLATGVRPNDFTGAESKIQAASLDLTIGGIYIPGVEEDKPGGAGLALNDHNLATGQTAVVKTKEELDLGADLAAVGFPPASLSLKGLLMTNPGHIDPGYNGPLHLTVINMSRVPFPLKVGDRILRVLFMPLDPHPDAPYNVRRPRTGRAAITPELLEKLSPDFVDVTARSTKIANDSVKRAQIWATVIPVIVAVLTVFGAPLVSGVKGDIDKLNLKMTAVETKLDLKSDLKALELRILKLEETAKAPTPTTPGSEPK
jgi:dCTP deaminase